jgi:AraC-like DNA-binding protein
MVKKTIYFIILFLLSFLFIGQNPRNTQKHNDKPAKKKKLKELIELTKNKRNISPIDNLQIGRELITIGEKNNDIKIKILGLQTMGFGYGCSGKLKKSFEMYKKSLRFAESIDDTNGEATTYSEMSNISYSSYNDFPKAMEFYKNAILSYRRAKNLYGEAKFQCKTGGILRRLGKYKSATKLFISALQNLEKLGRPTLWERFFVIECIADITCTLGNLKTAQEYIKQYEEMHKRDPNHRCKVRLLFLKSKLSMHSGNYENALLTVNKAYALQEELSKKVSLIADQRVKSVLLEHTLKVLLKTGRTAEMKDLFVKFDKMFRKHIDPYIIAKVLLTHAEYYYKRRQINLAIKTGLKSEKICNKYNFYGILLRIYPKLSEWYIEINRPELSLKYLKSKKAVELTTNSSRISADIMSIILGYEKNKTKKALGKLRTRNIKTIVLLCLFIVLLILLFWLIFARHKKDNLLKLGKLKKEYEESFEKYQKKIESFKENNNKKGISTDKGKKMMTKIIDIMNEDKLFLNSEFSLEELTKIMNINHYYLSDIINSYWGNNFNDLINTYRVYEAKKILEDSKFANLKIIDIGYDVGFNSISTFNRVFKSKVNITPKQYRKTFLISKNKNSTS